jgi:hypothetical protein
MMLTKHQILAITVALAVFGKLVQVVVRLLGQ